ncbi:MAG: hypothetical protein H0U59_05200 [Gemmatimonadaceae bacterium]|nr:hypothetical protein [Gemmatimonadaceae bacterium]
MRTEVIRRLAATAIHKMELVDYLAKTPEKHAYFARTGKRFRSCRRA